MATTNITIEQARKCPKCSVTGAVTLKETVTDNKGKPAKLETLKCENGPCVWFGSNWVVMIDSDGNVPVRDSGHEEKTFPGLDVEMTQAEANAYVDVITKDMEIT